MEPPERPILKSRRDGPPFKPSPLGINRLADGRFVVLDRETDTIYARTRDRDRARRRLWDLLHRRRNLIRIVLPRRLA